MKDINPTYSWEYRCNNFSYWMYFQRSLSKRRTLIFLYWVRRTFRDSMSSALPLLYESFYISWLHHFCTPSRSVYWKSISYAKKWVTHWWIREECYLLSFWKKKTIKTPFDVFPLEAAAHLPYLYAPSVPVSLRYTSTFGTLCTYRYQDIKRKNRKNRWGWL